MMTSNFLFEISPVLVLCLIVIVVLFVVKVWSQRYGRTAKALNKRLVDIVKIRSSLSDEPQIKEFDVFDSMGLLGIKFNLLDHTNEAIKLLLLRSGVDMEPSRLMLISVAFLSTGFLFLALLTPFSFLMLIILSLFFGLLPFLYMRHLQAKRSNQIEKQLPEALDFIGRSLRAGHALSVSFGIVGDELPQPIAKEFKTVFEEINFGLPFNEAMANFAVRTNSNDINFLVVALLIQREAGGNLIELLENLSKTIRDRMILKGKVRVLSSEGKYSGILLSVLPFILGAILSVINPNYMALLWTSENGQLLIMLSVAMILMGGFWMWNISRIEV